MPGLGPMIYYIHLPSSVATTAMPALQALQNRVAGAPRLYVSTNEDATEAVIKVAVLPEDEIELEALLVSAPWSRAIIAAIRESWREEAEEPWLQAVPKKRATRKKPA